MLNSKVTQNSQLYDAVKKNLRMKGDGESQNKICIPSVEGKKARLKYVRRVWVKLFQDNKTDRMQYVSE